MKRGRRIEYVVVPSLALAIMAFAGTPSIGAPDDLVAAARKEGQLNVIALPRDWCGYGSLIDGFKSKYGVVVTELQPDAGSAAEIEAIRVNSGPPTPDVVDVGLSFGLSAKKEGLLQPYRVSTWASIPDSAKDADGYWYGDYCGVLAFEINADIVKNVPADWPDLLRPEYRNSVALAGNPHSSNQAVLGVLAAGISAARGSIDQAALQGLGFIAELSRKGNFLPVIGDSDRLAAGETPILVRWDYLALADRERFKGNPRIEVVVPKTGLVAGVYVQAISASAPHPNAAKLWMEYLYSDEGQLAWLRGNCHPIRLKSLLAAGKVPDDLLEKLPLAGGEDYPVDPTFPRAEEQERARDIITNGWDAIVGVTVECVPSDPSSIPMSQLDDPAGEALSTDGPESGSPSQLLAAGATGLTCPPPT